MERSALFQDCISHTALQQASELFIPNNVCPEVLAYHEEKHFWQYPGPFAVFIQNAKMYSPHGSMNRQCNI